MSDPRVIRGWLTEQQRIDLVELVDQLPDSRVNDDRGSVCREVFRDAPSWPAWLPDKLAELADDDLRPWAHVVIYDPGGYHDEHHDQLAEPAAWEAGYQPPVRSVSVPLIQADADRECLHVNGQPVGLDAGDLVTFASDTIHEVRPVCALRVSLVIFLYPDTRPWPAKRRRLELITGPTSSGKTTHLHRRYNEALASGRPAYVVCPAIVAPGTVGLTFPAPAQAVDATGCFGGYLTDALLVADEAGWQLPDRYLHALIERARPHELVVAAPQPELDRLDPWIDDLAGVVLDPYDGPSVQYAQAPISNDQLVCGFAGGQVVLIHPHAIGTWRASGVPEARIEQWAAIAEPFCVGGQLADWVWHTASLAKPHPVDYQA